MKENIPKPVDHAEEVALFRHSIIGSLIGQIFSHGQLKEAIKELSKKHWRAPGSDVSKRFGSSTIERWYYAYQTRGLLGLLPSARSDRGRARFMDEKKKTLLIAIRDEYPWISSRLIIKTLMRNGVLEKNELSVATLNRFYKQHGKERRTRKQQLPQSGHRLRWQAEAPGHLFHADVCHGPTLENDGQRIPVRIHAILDDASRYVVALEVHSREREVEMLGMFTRAITRHGRPGCIYLDNGATYRGEGLKTLCARLDMGFLHAAPYDPEARGKMERFWRTMREQCLNFITEKATVHDIQVRLNAWLDEDYHKEPHEGLMGATPISVWGSKDRRMKQVSHEKLREASVVTEKRRIRGDNTIDVDGVTYEVDATFLSKKKVTLGKYLYPLCNEYAPFIIHEGRTWPLHRVDPVKNSKLRRSKPEPRESYPSTGFNPADTSLRVATGQIKEAS